MSSARWKFTEREIARLLTAVRKASVPIRIEISPDGKLVAIPHTPSQADAVLSSE